MRELIPVETSYVFADGKLADAAIAKIGAGNIDIVKLTELRDSISDEDCGRYRECWTKSSEIPGCGARITFDDQGLLRAECPAGTVVQYTNCAQRVLDAILFRLD